MKLVTASTGKKILKISKNEWLSIGKKAGWRKKALNLDPSHGQWKELIVFTIKKYEEKIKNREEFTKFREFVDRIISAICKQVVSTVLEKDKSYGDMLREELSETNDSKEKLLKIINFISSLEEAYLDATNEDDGLTPIPSIIKDIELLFTPKNDNINQLWNVPSAP